MSLLSVQGLGKTFRIYRSEWQRFARWFGISTTPQEEHWVLRNINFEVQAGESVGIIGYNGAGKSTLLKMITGTLQPSEGQVQINGRVAAILELGMGFNPELTGRQNAIHTAWLMGFNIEQIQKSMPEIEAFAEIGDFFDMPVRTYSSGMQMRVAFSVATSEQPDLLIVDEALSVGDAYFQHKCFDRLKMFRENGCSLLFVSHDINAIKNICDRSILIADGVKVFDGNPDDTFDHYNALLAQEHPEPYSKETDDHNVSPQGTRSGSGDLKVISVEMTTNGTSTNIIEQGKSFTVEVSLVANKKVEQWCAGISIRDRFGNNMFGTNTTMLNIDLPVIGEDGTLTVEFNLPNLTIGPGSYSISVALHHTHGHVEATYDWWDKAAIFEVNEIPEALSEGLCQMPVNCNIRPTS